MATEESVIDFVFGIQAFSRETANAELRKTFYGMALEVVCRAEHRSKSNRASAGVFPKPPPGPGWAWKRPKVDGS